MMTMDLLYLLPALAVLICLTGAVLPAKRGSKLFGFLGSKRKRYSPTTVLTARFTVIALLVATAITLIWPVPGVDPLFQGMVITFLCMIPLIGYLVVASLLGKSAGRSARRKRRHHMYLHGSSEPAVEENKTMADQPDDLDSTLEINAAISDAVESDPATSSPLANNLNAVLEADAKKNMRIQPKVVVDAPAQPDLSHKNAGKQSGKKKGNPGKQKKKNSKRAGYKQDTEVKEQMDRVSTLVKSYDLGDDEQSGQTIRRSRALGTNKSVNEAANSHSTDLASHNEQALQVSRTEALRKVIATLQEDKRKLQRLVIAQQAAFDSERQSHERTRHVARDAIKVMRDARSGQRMAEKIARRERAERRRLEKEYTKVTRALKNAMSTLATAEKDDNTSAA